MSDGAHQKLLEFRMRLEVLLYFSTATSSQDGDDSGDQVLGQRIHDAAALSIVFVNGAKRRTSTLCVNHRLRTQTSIPG